MRFVSFLSCVCFAACANPSKLTTNATATSTEELRLQEFAKYKATKLNQYTYTTEDGTLIETGRYTSINLGNNQTVTDPRALSALVLPDSSTAKAIKTFEQKQKRARILFAVNWTGIVTSVTLMGVGSSLTSDEIGVTPAGKALLASGAILLGGLAVPGVMRIAATDEKRAARTEAFLSYNESLQKRLGLCEEGEQIFDCNNAPNFAASQIAATSDPNQPATFDSCQEQRSLGFSLSEECQNILKKGTPQKAPEADLREPDLAEQEFALLLSLAEVLMRAQKYDEAFARLEDARKLRPEESIILFALGEVHRNKGSLNEACEHYRLYLKSDFANEANVNSIYTFLAGVDKTKNKSCDFKKP